MKICFVTLGDFEKMPLAKRATGMAKQLIKLGYEVYIVAQLTENNKNRLYFECPDIKPIWIKSKYLIPEIIEKIFKIRTCKPDLVYITSYNLRNLAFFKSLYIKKGKLIVEHSELYSAFDKPRFDKKMLEEQSIKEADGIVCASNYLRKEFSKRIEKRGLNKSTIYLPYAYPAYLRITQHQKTHDSFRILFMAALWVNYGVLDVINAVEKLNHIRKDFTLEIIGDGPARLEAEMLIDKLGLKDYINIHGFVKEEMINFYFANSDVFLAPLNKTIQDIARCPSKVYYYLPYNKPIVTCAFGDPYDLLGEYGFYYEPNNIEDMSKILNNALNASIEFKYKNGFIEKHSWDFRANEFIAWCKVKCFI